MPFNSLLAPVPASIRPGVRRAAAAGSLAFLGACASHSPPPDCQQSVNCLIERARKPLYMACMKDLHMHAHRNHRVQEAIEAEYQYPLTNTETYSDLLRWGMRVVSPSEWCNEYAARKTAIMMPSGPVG